MTIWTKLLSTVAATVLLSNSALAELEWRQKPVQCGPKDSFLNLILQADEIALMAGLGQIKVQGSYYRVPIYIFANTETGTFTIAEMHIENDEICVLAFGANTTFDVETPNLTERW